MGAAITGGLVGAGVGGGVGALAFPALGVGTSEEGYALGATVGGISGGIAGYQNFGIKKGLDKHFLEKSLNGLAQSFAEGSAAQGSASIPGGSFNLFGPISGFLTVTQPYLVGISGGAVIAAYPYNASRGDWDIPVISIFSEKF